MKKFLAFIITIIALVCSFSVAVSVHAANSTYKKITSADDLIDGRKYVLVYKYPANGNIYILSQTFATRVNISGDATRSGMDGIYTESFGSETVVGDFSQYEWILVKSGDKWLLKAGDEFLTIGNDSYTVGKLITKLSDTGEAFAISDDFTFTNANGVSITYNSRSVFNAAVNDPSTKFMIYALTDNSDIQNEGNNGRQDDSKPNTDVVIYVVLTIVAVTAVSFACNCALTRHRGR